MGTVVLPLQLYLQSMVHYFFSEDGSVPAVAEGQSAQVSMEGASKPQAEFALGQGGGLHSA